MFSGTIDGRSDPFWAGSEADLLRWPTLDQGYDSKEHASDFVQLGMNIFFDRKYFTFNISPWYRIL
jgi:hypothetical protein